MIELRWIVPVEGDKLLQYRQMVDTNVYAGLGPFPESVRNMQWSEWRNVPVVSESDPSCP